MDTLFLYNTKTLKEKFKTKVFAGDNHITKINVQIPDNIGGYPKRECEFNLRAIIPEGNLSYIINPNEPYFYITNDITETAQIVKLMMIITHAGNVIGRTNTVGLIVNEPAEAPDPPLTPRALADKVINEQRAEIAEQSQTITEQQNSITEKNARIGELTNTVTELSAANEELEEQHIQDENTIEDLTEQLNTSRLKNLDITVNNLDFFDSLSSNISVSGSVYVDGIILLSDKQRIETKFPQLSVTAEYIIDFDNFMIALTGGVMVDSDDNVLTFERGGAYQSNYTANDIDNFINTVNEELEILEVIT